MAQPNNANDYQTCCGSVHVKTATIGIGIFQLILLAISIILTAVVGTKESIYVDNSNLIVNLIFGCILLVILALMFFGVWKKRGNFLIPHLVWSVLSAIGCVILLILIFTQYKFDQVILYFFIIILSMVLHIYFFTVVYKCCMYFYDVEKDRALNPSGAPLGMEKSDAEFWRIPVQ